MYGPADPSLSSGSSTTGSGSIDPGGCAGEGGSVLGSNMCMSTDEYVRSELGLARTRIDELEARNASFMTKVDIEQSTSPPPT